MIPECVGLQTDIGTLTPGKYADLLVVDGDPVRDIGVLRDQNRFKLVMKGGEAIVDNIPAPALQPVG